MTVSSASIIITVLGKICQAESVRFFLVISVDKALAIAIEAADAVSGWVTATAGLHTTACLEARYHVSRGGLVAVARQFGAVGVVAREVKQVDAGKCDEEATEQREDVDGVGRAEAAEKDKRGTECRSSKRDVVEGIHTG